jgi:hypothetical protein
VHGAPTCTLPPSDTVTFRSSPPREPSHPQGHHPEGTSVRAPEGSVLAFPAPRPAAALLAPTRSGGLVLPLAMAFDRRRPAVAARAAVTPAVSGRSCACGHGKQAHEHYRRGSDCSFCGCAKFSRSRLRRLIAGR